MVSRRRAWRLAGGGAAEGHTAPPSESKAGWGEAYTSLSVQLGQEEQVPANLERERLGLSLIHPAAGKARWEEGGKRVAPLLEEDGEDDVLLLHMFELRQRLPWLQPRLHFLHMEKEVLRSSGGTREFAPQSPFCSGGRADLHVELHVMHNLRHGDE